MPMSNARSDDVAPSVSAHAAHPFDQARLRERMQRAQIAQRVVQASEVRIVSQRRTATRVPLRRHRHRMRAVALRLPRRPHARSPTASAQPGRAPRRDRDAARAMDAGPSKCDFKPLSNTRCMTHSNRSMRRSARINATTSATKRSYCGRDIVSSAGTDIDTSVNRCMSSSVPMTRSISGRCATTCGSSTLRECSARGAIVGQQQHVDQRASRPRIVRRVDATRRQAGDHRLRLRQARRGRIADRFDDCVVHGRTTKRPRTPRHPRGHLRYRPPARRRGIPRPTAVRSHGCGPAAAGELPSALFMNNVTA